MKGVSLLAAAGLSAGLFAAEFVNQFPMRVLYAKGDVAAAEAGMVEDGKSVTLAWKPGGGQPVVAYDYGGRTVGGYAVFKVTGFKAQGKDAEGREVFREDFSGAFAEGVHAFPLQPGDLKKGYNEFSVTVDPKFGKELTFHDFAVYLHNVKSK